MLSLISKCVNPPVMILLLEHSCVFICEIIQGRLVNSFEESLLNGLKGANELVSLGLGEVFLVSSDLHGCSLLGQSPPGKSSRAALAWVRSLPLCRGLVDCSRNFRLMCSHRARYGIMRT
jgi:hypothetical protein